MHAPLHECMEMNLAPNSTEEHTGNTEGTWRKGWQWVSRARIPGLWQCWEVISGKLRLCWSPKSHANRQEVELAFPTSLNQLGSEEKASEQGQWPVEESKIAKWLPNSSMKGAELPSCRATFHTLLGPPLPFANPVELPYQSGGPCNTPRQLPLVNPGYDGRKPPNVTMKSGHSQAAKDMDNIVQPLCYTFRETRERFNSFSEVMV